VTDWKRGRDAGFEHQFVSCEERDFKAAAHRAAELARWAADKMGLTGAAAERYVGALVTGDITHLRGRGIIARLTQDLIAAGVPISPRDVAAAFDRLDAASRAKFRDT